MDRLGAGARGRVEDALLVEVTLRGRAASEQIRLVGIRDVRRVAVGGRVDRNGSDPELAQRAEDADCDLATIGDQYLAENCHCPSYSPGR